MFWFNKLFWVLLHWLRQQFSVLTNKRLFVNVETQPTSKSCPVVSAKNCRLRKYLEGNRKMGKNEKWGQAKY